MLEERRDKSEISARGDSVGANGRQETYEKELGQALEMTREGPCLHDGSLGRVSG